MYGRFCKECKGGEPFVQSYGGSFSPVSKRDENRLESFIENPERYATGSVKAEEKVRQILAALSGLSQDKSQALNQAYERYKKKLASKEGKLTNDSLGKKLELLGRAMKDHLILRVRYKGLSRDLHPYASDGKYCIAFCGLRNDLRTFRIDRMQNISLADQFSYSDSLRREADTKIKSANTYKYRDY